LEALTVAKPIPSLERLKACFNYDEATGIFTHALARQGVKLGSRADRWATRNYRRIKIDYIEYAAHRCAWYIVHGVWPSDEIDHINGLPDDNRICNLREANKFQQAANTRKYVTGTTSRFKGVSFVKYGSTYKWRAAIFCNGKRTYLGWYDSEIQAAEAYCLASEELFGEFSAVNAKDLVEAA
jgi:hypothetical protein